MLGLESKRRSQFFQRRWHFSSQANNLSTTQRLGSTTLIAFYHFDRRSENFFDGQSKRLTGVAAVHEQVRNIRLLVGVVGRRGDRSSLRSVTFAVVIVMAWGNPCVSIKMWRLMPETLCFVFAHAVFLHDFPMSSIHFFSMHKYHGLEDIKWDESRRHSGGGGTTNFAEMIWEKATKTGDSCDQYK